MKTYYQGFGFVKHIRADAPTTWADGNPLQEGDIKHFLWDMAYVGGYKIEDMIVELIDDPETPAWDGVFTEAIDIDSQEPGVYVLFYRTVDRFDRVSRDSEPLIIRILPEPGWAKWIKNWFKKN